MRGFVTSDRVSGDLLEDLRDVRSYCAAKVAESSQGASATSTAKASTPGPFSGFRDPFTDEWVDTSSMHSPDDRTGFEDYGSGVPITPEPSAPRPWNFTPGPAVRSDDDSTGFE
jgi:hypothetical protein